MLIAFPPRLQNALRLILLGLAFACALPDGSARAQSAAQAPFVNWLLYVQQQLGYIVKQGKATTFSFADCGLYAADFGTCFGNNPLTPYVVLHPPVSPTSNTLPTYMKNDFNFTGPTGGVNGSTGATSNTFYQLDTNEAIVTVITLPPPAAYFSFQSYMFSRPSMDYGVTDPMTPPCMGRYPMGSTSTITMDCLSYQVFGYFDNAINNVVIQRAFGSSFSSDGSQVIATITTPNNNLYNALMNSFAPAFGNANQIFLERMAPYTTNLTPPVDNTKLHIGVTPGYDIDASIIRYAVPVGGSTNPTAPGPTWLANAATNVLVYRVQLPSPDTTPITPLPTINQQACNTNETLLSSAPSYCPSNGATFDADLQQIANLLLANLAVPGYTYQQAQFGVYAEQLTPYGAPKGPVCIVNGTTCVGSTEDNNAYRSWNIGQLAINAPAFVIGVIHSTSTDVTSTAPVNNAAYTSIGAADGTDNAGVAQISQANIAQTGVPPDSHYLSGSAAAVLTALGIQIPPSLNADLPNLYIAIFARPTCPYRFCSSGNAFVASVASSMSSPPNIPPTHSVLLTERAYMLPSVGSSAPLSRTLTGADARYLESPYVVYACPSSGCAGSSQIKRLSRH